MIPSSNHLIQVKSTMAIVAISLKSKEYFIAILIFCLFMLPNAESYASAMNDVNASIKNEKVKTNQNFNTLFTSAYKPSPDFTWTGFGGDNLWFTPENWEPNGVPSSSDYVVIGDNAQYEVLIQNANAYAFNISLSFTSTINIAAGASLTIGSGPLDLSNGYLKGSGTFVGDVHVGNGGHIAPGNPNTGTVGEFTIDGNLTTEMDAGALEIQINGTGSNQFSVLNVTGTADLLYNLFVFFGNYNGNYYSPHKFDNVVILSATSVNGSITNVNPPGWNPTNDDPSTGKVKITYNPPPPSNDDCDQAFPITNIPGYYNSYTINANNSLWATPSCNSNGHYDVWFSFVAPASGKILIHYFPSYVHAITLWSGTCGSLIEKSCYHDDNSGQTCNQILAKDLVSGDTYYIQEITENEESNVNFSIEEPINGPANDYCSDAIPITVGELGICPTGQVTGTTINAHHTENVSCTYDWECNNLDVWYSFTAPASGGVKFKPTMGNLSAVFYSGDCSNLNQQACLGQESSVFLTGGASYLLMISTRNNWQGEDFIFCLDEAPAPPDNNTCAGAISIPVSANGNCSYVTGTTINATSSLENPCPFGENELNLLDAWYSFEAPADGHVTFYSGTGDPTVAIYSGICASLSVVDNGCTKGSGSIGGLTAGQIYYLQVMTPGGETNFDFCLEISGAAPSNNDCLNASSMNLGTLITVPSTIYSISNPGLPPCAPTNLNTPSVWYKFIPSSDEVTYDNNNAFILALSLYTGCGGVPDILPDACALPYGNGNVNHATVIPGTQYYAQITTVPAKSSGFQFTLNETGTLFYPEIDVQGNSVSISDGDITPDVNDDTNFGEQLVCNGIVNKTYTIKNTSSLILHVTAINLSGLNASDFEIGGITLPIDIIANSSTTFTVSFNPAALGLRAASIEIVNDDADESNYDFAISGIGTGVYNMGNNTYYCNLQDALDAGGTGDELQIQSGFYTGPCIEVTKTLKMKAVGGVVILDCIEINGNGNMLDLDSDFTFNLLMLTNGMIHLNGHHLSCGSIQGGSTNSYIMMN